MMLCGLLRRISVIRKSFSSSDTFVFMSVAKLSV
jgi:hypothetical protein